MPQTRGGRRDSDRKRASSETTAAAAATAAGGVENNQNGGGAVAMAAVGNPNIENGNHQNGGACGGGGNNCKLTMGSNGGLAEEITDGCCCPSECIVGEPIDPNDPEDAVKIICSNGDCTSGQFMHRVCFETWEQSVLTHVRLSGRARNWSEKQMVQNLWTKKGFDVAYKACGCKCGHGHLRKDLDAPVGKQAPPVDDDPKKRRNRKKSGGKQPLGAVSCGGGGGANAIGGCGGGGMMATPRARSRTLSLGSVAGLCVLTSADSPPVHQQNSAPYGFGAMSKKSNSNLDFFSDTQVQNTGSIFQRRETMASFYEILPSWKVNGIHIKMEDDCPQGNDETRIFVLTSLGDHKMRKVPCVLCHNELVVYDKYPLIDGTFFMSPVNHGALGVRVRHDAREGYLFALCVYCLEHSHQFRCTRCGTNRWFVGDRLVLGTLYSYDVLASIPCCPPMCKCCRSPLPMPPAHNFSSFSEPTVCPHCGTSDLHFIRRLETVKRESAASA